MGLGGISIWQLLIILLIVVMIFGTKRLKNIGSDLGGAVKGFKQSMADEDNGEGSKEEAGTKGIDATTETMSTADNADNKDESENKS